MPTNPKDVVAAALSVLLVACVLVLLWYRMLRPGNQARQRVAALGRELGLLPVSSVVFGQEFCLGGMSWALGIACAAGQWRGMRAGILLQPMRSRRTRQYTWAILSFPHGTDIALSLQRGQPTFGATATPFSGSMAGTFTAQGPALEINRVFCPDVQARLGTFPRRLQAVYCNRNFTWLEWEGVESEATVCDRALELAAQIAKVRMNWSDLR